MAVFKSLALAGVTAPLAAQAPQLVASHFSGTIYSLNVTEAGEPTITGEISGVQRIPAWITWDSESRTAHVADESWFGPGTGSIASYALAEDGGLTVSGAATTDGGDLASGLYGGEDGRGFIAQAN